MALVDDEEEVLREKVDEAEGPLALLAPGKVARVILDAGAEAHLLHEVEVVFGPHLDALRLDELVLFFEHLDALGEFRADAFDGGRQLVATGDERTRRIELEHVHRLAAFARHGVERTDALHLVAPEFDAHRALHVRGEDVHHLAPHAETPALEADVVPFVEALHKAA